MVSVDQFVNTYPDYLLQHLGFIPVSPHRSQVMVLLYGL
ncbi:hypothetical protein T07_5316 [Trichinella nelsoni]|uniref:Uncharacterized protein n=1 Tax=Trichinella nelsoni TaxID=6336 RepID=A0A0V0RA33_9BILA|nr:hypothetical protein T07_5316 [Trichinella nelsoni]